MATRTLPSPGFRLSRRVEQRHGRFVPHGESPHAHGHFEVDTVPAPAHASRELVPTGDGPFQDFEERIELHHACPSCLADIAYRFTGPKRASYHLIDELLDGHDRAIDAALSRDREVQQWLAECRQREARVERHLYAFDDRDDG